MNRKLVTYSSALLAALILAGVIAPVARADTAGTLDSYAKVAFAAPTTGPVNVLNPNTPDPTDPVTPTNPDGTTPSPGTSGPLSLDFVSSLDFGTHYVSSADQTYYAAPQKITDSGTGTTSYVPDYVQVTDNRGTFVGWKLSVHWDGQLRQDATVDETTGANAATGGVLTGSVLTMTGATAVAPDQANAGTAPAVTDPITMGTADVTVMNAPANAGIGTWIDRFGADADYTPDDGTATIADGTDASASGTAMTASPITLQVPGSTAKKTGTPYTTNLVWTLADTPDTD